MWEIHSSYCPGEGIQAADRRMLELTCSTDSGGQQVCGASSSSQAVKPPLCPSWTPGLPAVTAKPS